ncbi:hypothetical protein [Sphingomonas sp. PL20]|uniref:hypothetical protein n=1 Tax=Sphingomonas sp. PL20 TaxID=2760712 RepID=UPI001AEA4768
MKKTKKRFYLAAAAGLLLTGAVGASADPGYGQGHGRESRNSYYPGPNNSRIPYQTGYYQDAGNRRQQYTYPSDWQNYGRPQSWYQGHPAWHTFDRPDYYRRGVHR